MKFLKKLRCFTLIELLVVISIIAILAGLAIPALTSALTRGQLIQAVSNARQIHLVTQTAALDVIQTGSGNVGWPGDFGTNLATAVSFAQALVNNKYLQSGDLKIFAASGIIPATDSASITANNIAFYVYQVAENDGGNVVFLTTKNFTAANGGGTVNTTAKPFGDKGFVVFRKGGDGTFYKSNQNNNNDVTNMPALSATPLQ